MKNHFKKNTVKATSGLFHILSSVIQLMDSQDKRKFFSLLLVMVFSAFFSAIGIAMVVPFVALAANPALIEANQTFSWLYHYFHFNSLQGFLIFLGVLSLMLLVIGNSTIILVGWWSAKVAYGMKYKWINSLFLAYLNQPYSFFLYNRTSDLSKNLLHTIDRLTREVIIQILDLFSKGLSIVAILIILIIVNPMPALSIVFGVGFIYFFIFLGIKNTLKNTNQYLAHSAQQMYQIIEETFCVIKEIKLYQKENVYSQKFEIPTRYEQYYQAIVRGFTPMPRFLLEIFAFGSIVLLVLYLLLANKNLTNFLPVLGFLAVTLYRIMPLTQNVFTAFSNILIGKHVVEEILTAYQTLTTKSLQPLKSIVPMPGDFKKIRLSNINFSYPNSSKPIISSLNLTISAGEIVAFIGPSGSGKSTIVDILLGLLKPDSGEFYVDKTLLRDGSQIKSWQSLLGYVPQQIMLTNQSILQNIAFGKLPHEINYARVVKAAKIASIHEFIESLSEGYDTMAGDKGVRLSGGQCQRIGIARAFYHDPQVIILDEATNALDNLTEMAIMKNIRALAGEKTIIIVSHQLQTVKECNRLFYIEHGRLVAEGSYEDLLNSHSDFQKMVGIGENLKHQVAGSSFI